MTTRRALVAVLCGASLLAGCGEPDAARADGNVRVFAAASLVAPFQAIARAFAAEH